jgi:hypothetical protein
MLPTSFGLQEWFVEGALKEVWANCHIFSQIIIHSEQMKTYFFSEYQINNDSLILKRVEQMNKAKFSNSA